VDLVTSSHATPPRHAMPCHAMSEREREQASKQASELLGPWWQHYVKIYYHPMINFDQQRDHPKGNKIK
jgi:hypothetical protein